VLFDNLLGYGQAQATPSLGAGSRFVHTVEAIEDVLLFGWSDAHACVFNLYDGARSLGSRRDPNRTLRAIVLDGVVDQVGDDLLDASGIPFRLEYLRRAEPL
jgi:hypothetical protein